MAKLPAGPSCESYEHRNNPAKADENGYVNKHCNTNLKEGEGDMGCSYGGTRGTRGLCGAWKRNFGFVCKANQ